MAVTPSTMTVLGRTAPDFTLPCPKTGNTVSLQDIQSDVATVVMFICNHCPFVVHVAEELTRLANDYLPKGIAFVAINSNDIENYPADSPDKMVETAEKYGFPFPYLFDESQETAKAYQAACTPDFYIFDKALKCVYCGQLDDARPSNDEPVTGKDIRAALESMLTGEAVSTEQHPSIGCNIKWK